MGDVSVSVVGLGSMGKNHARVLAELPGVRLCAVADTSREARDAYRAPPGVRVHADYRALFDAERPDAVVVAVPPELHREIACAAIERGVHVLVEKPIAKRLDDAAAIVDAARAHRVKLMVGHIERFNPAIVELRRRVAANELGAIFQLHARRLLPFPSRVASVGVVLDLASHDIDAMHYVTGSRVVRAYAETARKAHATYEDMLSGLLRFESGQIGVLDVTWLSAKKLRELRVVGEGGTLVVDYLTQDLHWFQSGRADHTWEQTTHFSDGVTGDAHGPHVAKAEPLRAELEAFISCVAHDLPSPVSGEAGMAAVQVALDLMASGVEGRPIVRP